MPIRFVLTFPMTQKNKKSLSLAFLTFSPSMDFSLITSITSTFIDYKRHYNVSVLAKSTCLIEIY